MKEWNTANPDKTLKKDHKIIAVNGIRGDSAAMIDAMKKDDIVEITVREDRF